LVLNPWTGSPGWPSNTKNIEVYIVELPQVFNPEKRLLKKERSSNLSFPYEFLT
jgi:hypothetical protein